MAILTLDWHYVIRLEDFCTLNTTQEFLITLHWVIRGVVLSFTQSFVSLLKISKEWIKTLTCVSGGDLSECLVYRPGWDRVPDRAGEAGHHRWWELYLERTFHCRLFPHIVLTAASESHRWIWVSHGLRWGQDAVRFRHLQRQQWARAHGGRGWEYRRDGWHRRFGKTTWVKSGLLKDYYFFFSFNNLRFNTGWRNETGEKKKAAAQRQSHKPWCALKKRVRTLKDVMITWPECERIDWKGNDWNLLRNWL